MQIIELILDDNEELSGIDAISVVENPAIEEDFVALKNQEIQLAEADKEKRILIGALLIPNKPIVDDRGKQYLFKPGDKAIQTKNEIVRHEHSSDYVVNGDFCEIISIEKRQVLAKFFYPDRTVVLDRVANHLKLAYAITCHKFQGSEAPVVIIPVHSSFAYFVTRPWIYTAISRAQEICITVGQFSAIKKAIEKAHSNKRITKLEEKLRATLRQQPQPGKYNREGRLKRVVKKVPLPAMEPAF